MVRLYAKKLSNATTKEGSFKVQGGEGDLREAHTARWMKRNPYELDALGSTLLFWIEAFTLYSPC
jgi:hypothetical protein